jgi:hypothetical protein
MSTPHIPFQSDQDLSGSGFRSNRIAIRPQKNLKQDLYPSGSAAYKLTNKYTERLTVNFTGFVIFFEAFLLQFGLIFRGLGVGPD